MSPNLKYGLATLICKCINVRRAPVQYCRMKADLSVLMQFLFFLFFYSKIRFVNLLDFVPLSTRVIHYKHAIYNLPHVHRKKGLTRVKKFSCGQIYELKKCVILRSNIDSRISCAANRIQKINSECTPFLWTHVAPLKEYSMAPNQRGPSEIFVKNVCKNNVARYDINYFQRLHIFWLASPNKMAV